ncbi:alkyl hydroperoxide reductase [alpha proteobacterium AAP81b]|nr:alkyl hydroperoxide reductase [alpha proteobacterium AAP81b]
MTLQDKLDAFKANFETKVAPPAAVAIMHAATAALIASGQADRSLGAGAIAPAFALPDAAGTIVRSEELLARGPLVITFYRGVWCPYCNIDLAAIEAIADDIRAAGATLVAISPQTAANSRKITDANRLSFPILTDLGSTIADRFGLRFRLPDDLLALYAGFGADLKAINAEASGTLPMPARFVIGQDGVIAYAEVSADYTRRPDPEALLPALRRLSAARPAA